MFQLATIFASHMVLAADVPVRIFGAGEGTVSVSFNGVSASGRAENGRWMVELPAMPCGGPYELRATDGNRTIVLEDVHMGRVYLCAGQSNMQLRLEETDFPAEKYEDNDKLRFFATARLEDNEPFFPSDGWMISTRDTAARRSAIGYLVGNEISRKENVAVGIVCCYQGASVIESWLPKGALQRIGIHLTAEEKGGDHTEPIYEAWYGDGVLYEFALSQVAPLGITAVIWYQGESDTSSRAEAQVYERELAEMIRIWRRDLQNGDLPFVIIQLADFLPANQENWKLVQQAQLNVMRLTHHVKTVVCADVCQNEFIHPVEKQVLSHRVVQALEAGF